MREARPEEVLIALLARLIGRARHVGVGALSPIPAMAAFLAQAGSAEPMQITVLGSRRHNHFTDGGRELFDCAGQGRLDVFFLSGGQIDGQANLNLVGSGGYPGRTVRFPGSFGSAYLYFVVPQVILFREEHSPRVFVPKVDFVSAPGVSAPNVYRPGGPAALITGKAHFAFDRSRARFRLVSVHPGMTVEEVRRETGFAFDEAAPVLITDRPDGTTLDLIRGPIVAKVEETYPRFAERLLAS